MMKNIASLICDSSTRRPTEPTGMRRLSWCSISIPYASRSEHVVSGRAISHVQNGWLSTATVTFFVLASQIELSHRPHIGQCRYAHQHLTKLFPALRLGIPIEVRATPHAQRVFPEGTP